MLRMARTCAGREGKSVLKQEEESKKVSSSLDSSRFQMLISCYFIVRQREALQALLAAELCSASARSDGP